jgi:hypothetical protein
LETNIDEDKIIGRQSLNKESPEDNILLSIWFFKPE